MNAYTEFSKWYDEFMEDVPYDEWFEFVKKTLYENKITDGIVCELGAGTGNFTMKLAEVGFDMIGIDNSNEMLNVAINKKDTHKALENNPFDMTETGKELLTEQVKSMESYLVILNQRIEYESGGEIRA